MIDSYGFGSLVINGSSFNSDLIIYPNEGGMDMKSIFTTKTKYLFLGFLIAVIFVLATGFRLPSPQPAGGSYQFFKEKENPGVWVFEPDTGVSKFFDMEKGIVIINSFQMDSITVKSNAKIVETKG